jgi:hypothetical protein
MCSAVAHSPPEQGQLNLDAVRWGAASSADVMNTQAPLRSGIDTEDDLPCGLRAVGAPADGAAQGEKPLIPQNRRASESSAIRSQFEAGGEREAANPGKDRWNMKGLVLALALVGAGGVALAEDRTVVVPTDDKPFTVEKGDIVRLTGKGIAGSKIEARVEGPAKVEATSTVRELVNGRPLLGNQTKEFDLKPTGTGTVTVTITVTPPQPDAKPKVTRIEFEVK